MKNLILTIVAFIISGHLFSQDIIVLRTGDEIMAKIIEVGTEEIKYKKYENLNGPNYSMMKNEVFMIRYENGSKDVFKQTSSQPAQVNSQPSSNDQKSTGGDPLPKGSFNINPLGLLQFGPIFQLETRISQKTYLVPHFRYAYLGVLTHAVWTGFEDGSELSPGSMALGLGLKSFASPTGNTWYYGGIVDYTWGTAQYDIGESWATEEKAKAVAVVSNFGHRWRSGRGTYVNLGLLAGVAYSSSEEYPIGSGSTYYYYDETTVFAMIELSFGWEFKQK